MDNLCLTVDRKIVRTEETSSFRRYFYPQIHDLSKSCWVGNQSLPRAYVPQIQPLFNGEINMKGILLWLVGIPIPIIILLYIFNVL
ncbi:MAG: hypothetical protein DI551_11140 [Micavibrio aeruginosavorus]|uniref:Uncharacterized protein n=1 Tax=Micavibrio aeruginosavorus TaxID=349221 RepID=A0A2W5MT61_9BACT|nr:MAG: hypothetical protein DI551_11140 [Micavibrio aeruginosavorus]